MSNERIDITQYEGHTPEPWVWMEWNTWLAGGNEDGFDGKFLVERPIEVADEDKVDGLLIRDAPKLLAELIRCYKRIDDLKWKHMQVLRERKELRDEGLRMAKKLDSERKRIESLTFTTNEYFSDTTQ